MNKITLLDLECILLYSDTFECEYNEKRQELTKEELWSMVHSKELDYAELVEDNFIFVKFKDNEELIIFYNEIDNIDIENIDNSMSLEYEKFLEENGEKIAKEYKKIGIV